MKTRQTASEPLPESDLFGLRCLTCLTAVRSTDGHWWWCHNCGINMQRHSVVTNAEATVIHKVRLEKLRRELEPNATAQTPPESGTQNL